MDLYVDVAYPRFLIIAIDFVSKVDKIEINFASYYLLLQVFQITSIGIMNLQLLRLVVSLILYLLYLYQTLILQLEDLLFE